MATPYLTLNISETVRDRDIVTMGYFQGLAHALLKGGISNDLEWPWVSEIFNATKHRAISLRQLSFVWFFFVFTCTIISIEPPPQSENGPLRNGDVLFVCSFVLLFVCRELVIIIITRCWHVTISCQPDGRPPQPVQPWKSGRVHLAEGSNVIVLELPYSTEFRRDSRKFASGVRKYGKFSHFLTHLVVYGGQGKKQILSSL